MLECECVALLVSVSHMELFWLAILQLYHIVMGVASVGCPQGLGENTSCQLNGKGCFASSKF